MHYIINIKSLLHKCVYLFEENISQNPLSALKSDDQNFLETNTQAGGWGSWGKIRDSSNT